MPSQEYRLVVEGELGPRYSSAFAGMTVLSMGGRTEIRGTVVDAAQLHGLVERIAGLGLTLHSLSPVGSETSDGVPPNPHATDGGAGSKAE